MQFDYVSSVLIIPSFIELHIRLPINVIMKTFRVCGEPTFTRLTCSFCITSCMYCTICSRKNDIILSCAGNLSFIFPLVSNYLSCFLKSNCLKLLFLWFKTIFYIFFSRFTCVVIVLEDGGSTTHSRSL